MGKFVCMGVIHVVNLRASKNVTDTAKGFEAYLHEMKRERPRHVECRVGFVVMFAGFKSNVRCFVRGPNHDTTADKASSKNDWSLDS